jgi:hypothetical protein
MGLEYLEPVRTFFERIIVYSMPGFGKTRLITSLTPRFGDILYLALDKGSYQLASVLKKYQFNEDGSRRIHVLRPMGDDPIQNFSEFALRDWRNEPGTDKSYPFKNVRTLVVDTYSALMNAVLMHIANTGMVNQEQHFQIGKPGEPGSRKIPNRGDYNGAANISRGFIDDIFENQDEMHIIFAMHEDPPSVDEKTGVAHVGSPQHPGKVMQAELPSLFPTVIRLIRKPILKPDGSVTSQVLALTEPHGQYLAKLREDDVRGNQMPEVELDIDPINFWERLDQYSLETGPPPVVEPAVVNSLQALADTTEEE